MPGMDGFEVAARLRTLERSRETPLLFLTAQEVFDEQVVRGYKLGAVDFILKPFEPATLRAKVSVYTELSRRARGLESKLRETVDLEDRPTILLVDDVPGTLLAHAAALTDLNARLLTARNGYEALRLLLDQEPALILLDVHLPGLDGFETARLIRQRPRLAHVPILFVTATARAGADVTRGYGAGALDFLFLPMRPEVLQSKVQAVLNQFRRERLLQRQLREIERLEAASAAAQQQLKTFSETLEDKVQAQTAALRASAAALQKSETNFRLLFEHIADGVLVADAATGRFVTANPMICQMLGWSAHELLSLGVEDIHPPADLPGVLEQFGQLVRQEINLAPDIPVRRKDGSVFYADTTACPVEFEGRPCMLGVFRDITERKQARDQLRRLNRALRAISECNQALVRAASEPELLQTICRIVVEHGGYRMAWVGYAEPDEAKSVCAAAQAGFEAGYLETLGITWADTERGRGPSGTAIRTGQPCVCRDILTDSRFAPWRADALKRGYASSISLPMRDGERTFGALSIYSERTEAFNRRASAAHRAGQRPGFWRRRLAPPG
jgi:PAS domain S-box-containing protein